MIMPLISRKDACLTHKGIRVLVLLVCILSACGNDHPPVSRWVGTYHFEAKYYQGGRFHRDEPQEFEISDKPSLHFSSYSQTADRILVDNAQKFAAFSPHSDIYRNDTGSYVYDDGQLVYRHLDTYVAVYANPATAEILSVEYESTQKAPDRTTPRKAQSVYVGPYTKINADPSGKPEAPSGVTATNDDGKVVLHWLPSHNAKRYWILRGTYAGWWYSTPYKTIQSTKQADFTDTDVNNGSGYYYVVVAQSASGLCAFSPEVLAMPSRPNPRTYNGDFVISNERDLRFFQTVSKITGNLYIGTSLTTIALPNLREVGGDLGIDYNLLLTSIELPALGAVRGIFSVTGNNELRSFAFPMLTRVGGLSIIENNLLDAYSAKVKTVSGTVEIGSNRALKTLTLEELVSVGGNIEIHDNATLISAAFPSLLDVRGDLLIGGFLSHGNRRLTTLSLPLLSSIKGSFQVGNNASLDEFSLPLLTSVGQSLTVQYNDDLQTFSLPLLTSIDEYLSLLLNQSLTSVSLPALSYVGKLYINTNASLCTSVATSLATQTNNQSADIADNKLGC